MTAMQRRWLRGPVNIRHGSSQRIHSPSAFGTRRTGPERLKFRLDREGEAYAKRLVLRRRVLASQRRNHG